MVHVSKLLIQLALVLALSYASPASGATLRVPKQFKTIQAAIDAAKPGDTIRVAQGVYKERIQLKPRIIVRSDGDNSKGKLGLRRAEATILDGNSIEEKKPGVIMAADSILDGFTITKVGQYDETVWKQHHATRGEDLKDEQGTVGHGTSGIEIRGVDCVVKHCLVHHNGHVGIAIRGLEEHQIAPLVLNNIVYRNMGGGIGIADGAEPIVSHNRCYENLRAGIGCRNANPVITNNICHENIRAGIGNRQGSKAIIRGNTCFKNRRAGIGSRMKGTRPIIAGNRCYQNDMAGIGSRDNASPIIRKNLCYKNKMAGIGTDGAQDVLIIDNECRENLMAGIGAKNKASVTILNNRCTNNKLVAIGVIRQSQALIQNNKLTRKGGMPPIVAVKDGSTATLVKNRINGGGVAGVLVQGDVVLENNHFVSKAQNQGTAVWVWVNSKAKIIGNQFHGYRNAVRATKSDVIVVNNTIEKFEKTAILIQKPSSPSYVLNNTAYGDGKQLSVVAIDGMDNIVNGNTLKANHQGP